MYQSNIQSIIEVLSFNDGGGVLHLRGHQLFLQ